MVETLEINSTQVRQLLKSWEYPAKLGTHPLAQLTCVEQHFSKTGQSESDIKRGQAVKEILNTCIQTLRPTLAEPDPFEKEWRTFLIITERYCFGRLPEWIMVNLGLSSRSFYRELKEGIDQIVVYLNHLEDEAKNNPQELYADEVEPLHIGKLQPPGLPDQTIIGRSSLVEKVADLLVHQRLKKMALFGLPGVGKTTVTLEIIENKLLNAYFVDGIAWMGLGPKVSVEQELYRLASLAGISDSLIGQLTVDELKVQIQGSLATKKMLFIFDDLWDSDHIHQLCLQGKESAVLCTTRQPSLAIDFAQPAGALSIPELDLNQSKLLINDIAPNLFEGQDEKIEMLHQLAGGLPLALTIFGRYLRRQGYQGQTHRLHRAFEKLKEREARQAISINLEQHDLHRSLEKNLENVINLSCDTLTPSARQLFHSLSIIPPKPNSFDFDTALYLSNQSADPLYELIDSGLVESVGEDRYTLHQAIFDVSCSISPPKTAGTQFAKAISDLVKNNQRSYPALERNRANIDAAINVCGREGLIYKASQILVVFVPYLIERGQLEIAQNHASVLTQHWGTAPDPHDHTNQLFANTEFLNGLVSNQLGHFDDSIKSLNKALSSAESEDLSEIQLKSLFILLSIYVRRADRQSSEKIIEQIKHQISKPTDKHLVGEAYVKLSQAYYTLQEIDQAHHHLLKAKPIYENNGLNMGLIWKMLGLIGFERADFSSAIVHYEKALEAFEAHGMEVDRINVLNNIAVVYMCKAQWIKALDISKEVYAKRQELGEIDGCMISLANLSYIALDMRDAESAAHYIGAGLELAREKQILYREISFLINQSAVAELRGDFESAVEHGKEAFGLAKEADLKMSQGLAAAKVMIAYLAQDSLDEAELWTKKTYNTFKELNRPNMLALANHSMAELYFRKDNLMKAHEHLEEALPYFDRAIDEVPIEMLQISAQILKQVGDETRAADYRHKAEILLKQQSGQIKDPSLKKAFLDHFNANFEN